MTTKQTSWAERQDDLGLRAWELLFIDLGWLDHFRLSLADAVLPIQYEQGTEQLLFYLREATNNLYPSGVTGPIQAWEAEHG